MNLTKNRLVTAAAGTLWALLANVSVQAEDVELFIGSPNATNQTRPNILLILDDSGSMAAQVVSQSQYDPTVTYSGSCATDRVYWSRRSSTPPDCSTNRWFEQSALVCDAALNAFQAHGGGSYYDRMAQYDPRNRREDWGRFDQDEKSWTVECEDDYGIHGDGTNANEVYPQNGDSNNLFTNNRRRSIWWAFTGDNYTLFSGNYMNWYYSQGAPSTRIQVMKDVATNLINGISGVNIGLMSFNYSQGGLVRHAIEDVSTARSSLVSAVNNLTASNWTPLSETLYEAHQYFTGKNVVYGGSGDPNAFDPNNSGRYLSPIEYSCQKNHVVLLTDGEPTQDHDVTNVIPGLSDYEGDSFSTLTGQTVCDTETYPSGLNPDGGECLDDLAHYMYAGDMSPLTDQQNVTTHTVGFLIDLPILEQTAQRGGGDYYTANDTATLSTALTSIVTNILETQAMFVAPSVSINAFNQTRNLDDMYFSVFQPAGTTHWPGNLKKYELKSDGTVVDANGNPAVDQSTGFFADTSQSIWSQVVDGADVELGGAASLIPTPRNVYTNLSGSNLTAAGNRIDASNTAITDTMLGTDQPDTPTRDEVIDFINGFDAADHDADGNVTEPRMQMGDPLHSRPATVIYGPTNADGRVYFATNDGFLHSIDTETGVEQWSFVPEEFLETQVDLFINGSTSQKNYGIDGSLSVQIHANRDNVIDHTAGEKVYLYFGVRRGGSFYYALDVSDPDNPKLMWRLDGTELPNVGQTWATPTPARIRINGANQNPDHMVLVIGGGYDLSQDSFSTSTDTTGNAIYIVDSVTGDLLWHASDAGATENFSTAAGRNATMEYSIPAPVKTVDINSDGYADRMYVGDMGGQLWRFDIHNGNPVSDLVTGGVIASLGAAAVASPTYADTRRFYESPDTAFVSTERETFLHIGIGSGHRAAPNSMVNEDRFYAIRDYRAFSWLTQAQFDATTPFLDGDFVDVADDIEAQVPSGSAGWKYELRNGGWRGEKVLAEAVTFDGEVFFNTFRPGSTGNSCTPSLGVTRQYRVSLFNGSPVTNLDGPIDADGDGIADPLTAEDRYREQDGSILSRTTVIFVDEDDNDGDGLPDGQGTVGCAETDCSDLDFDNSPRRTFWNQLNVDD